jgi:hypothetical protein
VYIPFDCFIILFYFIWIVLIYWLITTVLFWLIADWFWLSIAIAWISCYWLIVVLHFFINCIVVFKCLIWSFVLILHIISPLPESRSHCLTNLWTVDCQPVELIWLTCPVLLLPDLSVDQGWNTVDQGWRTVPTKKAKFGPKVGSHSWWLQQAREEPIPYQVPYSAYQLGRFKALAEY